VGACRPTEQDIIEDGSANEGEERRRARTAPPNRARRRPGATPVLLVALTLGLTLVRSALAADLAIKAPPAPDWSWTGLYAGFHAGWGWASDSTGTATSAFTASPISPFEPVTLPLNSSGAMAGVQLGYNWQFAPRWVVLGHRHRTTGRTRHRARQLARDRT
jgi:opacity protein-like surface antigen